MIKGRESHSSDQKERVQRSLARKESDMSDHQTSQGIWSTER